MDNIRRALLALLVPPLEPGAQQGDGETWVSRVSLNILMIISSPDMRRSTVTSPTMEVNIMEEKQ